MELHENCRQRLLEKIQEALAVAKVRHGYFLLIGSLEILVGAAAIIPRSFQDIVRGWISDEPIRDFVYGVLSEELRGGYSYDSSDVVRLLKELPEYLDTSDTAARILAAFESLPWPYTLIVPTPLVVDELSSRAIGENFRIGEGLRLIAGAAMLTDLPLDEREEDPILLGFLQRDRGPSRWQEDKYYVSAEVSGFMADYIKSGMFQSFEFTLRSLFGIGLADKAFSLVQSYSLLPYEDPVYIYSKESGSCVLKRPQLLPAQISGIIRNLRWWDRLESGPVDQAARFLATLCREVCVPFESGRDREVIRLAGQWYFDGLCSTDELLSFVQSMVALEIMLGDKATSDLVGLGQLLANRCAYLIGKTSAKRAEILNDFVKIYDTRSQIVHGGKNRLSQQERDGLYSARWMCQRVIQEEIKLLLADHPSGDLANV
jgi:hypothetical protein